MHYPGSYAELRVWFPDDEACMDWLRWPVCPGCGRAATAVTTGRVWRCGGCRKRASRTAGTIFQDTRTPLTVVRRGLVHDRRSGPRVGVDDAEATGAGFLPDGVDDAAPLPDRDGAARSGGPHRARGGRRDLPRRGVPWGAWARRAGQDAGGDRGRAARAAWLRSGPDEHHPERGGQDPAQVPDHHVGARIYRGD